MAYMTELDFQRGARTVANIPSEVRAVRSMEPLVSGLAQSDAQRYVEGTRQGMERERNNAIMEDARRDRRMAIRDSRIALPLTVAGVGLNAIGASEQRAQTRQAELNAQAERDLLDALRLVIREYPRDIELLTKGMHPSQQGTSSSGMQLIAPSQMIGGG